MNMKSFGRGKRTIADEAAAYDRLIPLLNFNKQTGQVTWKVSRGGGVKVGDIAGTRVNKIYRRVRFEGKDYFLHRIWFYKQHGYLPLIIDHIRQELDSNGFLDNRPDNLRGASAGENQCNKSTAQKHSKTGVKGVFPSSKNRKKPFCVFIRLNGKSHNLGYCNNVYGGYILYNTAARRLHGKFHTQQRVVNGLILVK